MKTPLSRRLVALLGAAATLAMATLIDASSSSQVEQLGLLAVPRTGHAATALADGRVLITGGRDSAGTMVATAEVFDPANQTSTAIGVLNTARINHTATLLADGRVLIVGGTSASGALTSAEIFDPANPGAGFRVLSATIGAARAGHTATRLHDGTVLIAGGDDAGTAEIFKPTTESFSSTLLAMAAPRNGHTATLFSDDSVLLAGGNTDSMEYFSSVDQAFTLDPQKMTAARTGHDAIGLSDTRLLFLGGDTGHTIDQFNTSADTLTLKATMDGAESSATLLANGKILLLGLSAAGLYSPDAADQTTAFTAFDETSVPGSTELKRTGQTATELSGDKKILVAGGENAQHQPILQVATFNPARIWTDKDDYQPDDPVILSGSGWKPNENVYLYAVDNETEAWTYESTVAADANGGFVVSPYFIVELRHLGVQFHVTALGAQSTMQADVKFTDAGSFDFDPTSQSYINPPANTQFIENVTAPKNNGIFNASLVFTGTGGTQIPSSWVTISPGAQTFTTTSSAGDNKTWTVTINVPSGQPDGVYTGHFAASVSGSGGPNPGPGTNLTITVDHTPPAPPSTPDLSTGDDTGLSNTDNITNKTNVTVGGNGAEANSTVELFDGITSLGTTQANGGGNWTKLVNLAAGSPPVGNPPHSITATVRDAGGNTSDPSGALSVTVDTSPPTATINLAAGQADPASTGPINFTVTFNESVANTFVSTDVVVSGTAGATSATVTGGPTTFNVAVATPPNTGTVTVSFPVGAATDIAGNPNSAPTIIDNTVTYNPCTAPSSASLSPSGTINKAVGDSVTFSVTANGTTPLHYQWRKNTVAIVGAPDSSSYTIASVVAGDAGSYDVVVSNSCGNTTSNAVTLTVNKITPTINWSNPADITYGTALSGTQLNATATYNSNPVAGTFTYTPASGTVLSAGNNQELKVDFTPTDAATYNSVTGTTVHINVLKKTLTASIINDPTKPYDGNTDATLGPSNFSLSGLVGTDNFTVTKTTGTYNSKDVATATTVTVNLAAGDFTPTGGALASNYNLPTTASGPGHITPVTLTASIIGNPTKQYNCNMVATLTSANFSLAGLVGSENFTVTQTAGAYNSKDVVSANMVTATLAATDFTGTNGGIATNYVLPTSASGPGDIIPTDATISVTAYTSPTTKYNCNFHMATGTATGCDGDLSALFDFSDTSHKDAGDYPGDSWRFNSGSSNPNYNSATGTVHDSIAKADATINVTAYHVTYNCNAHTAIGTATGLSCDGDLSNLLDLSGTTHTNAGTFNGDAWSFAGNANYNSANGTVDDSIAKANTTSSVTSNVNPSIIGQNVTFTATVAGNPAVTCNPTGTVTFKDGATTLMAGVALTGGSATFSTSSLSAGNHSITAVYGADSNFNGSTSAIFTQSVQYIFVGFLPPIDNLPIINSSKAGQTIPIKWQLKDYAGNLIDDLGTLASNGLTSGSVQCGAAAVDVVEELSAPGSTVFRFDGTQFIYNWQTTKSWTGGCRMLQVKLSDGTSHYAQFTFK
jgi:Bacterial Ig-like domain (group 3)/YDG domain/Bacterial Ig-like domain/Galactose oxidase, central domain/Immunoglobulin I-set domain